MPRWSWTRHARTHTGDDREGGDQGASRTGAVLYDDHVYCNIDEGLKRKGHGESLVGHAAPALFVLFHLFVIAQVLCYLVGHAVLVVSLMLLASAFYWCALIQHRNIRMHSCSLQPI